MNADEAVLEMLISHEGEFVWDRNATTKSQRNGYSVHRRNPPPEASFKRLADQGYVQVETHNVSVWKNAETWRDRVDIRVALTDRGWQHAANLGLLD